ncbi:MAG: hypothetical protein ABR509_06000 [Candidatus Limnocylindria bacterium]
MADLRFALVNGDNFDRMPDPALAGASCRGCDYWETLDGARQGPPSASRRAAKLARLTAGARLAGSYALLGWRADQPDDSTAIAYAQFGPISVYPRAQAIRDRYPDLPESPPPYVITCLQVNAGDPAERGEIAEAVLREVCAELDRRGVVGVEAYPESVADAWLPSPGPPAVYEAAGFAHVAGDDRYPVFRIELSGGGVDLAWPAELLGRSDDADEWPLPIPRAPADDAWPPLPKPKTRNPFGED